MSRPVNVSGLGVISAFGASHEAFRDALLEGRSGIAPIGAFATSGCRTTLAAPVSGFDPARWVAPLKLRRMDRTGALAVAAARLAMEDAGVPQTLEGHDDVGVLLGTWTAGGQVTEEYLAALFRGGPTGAPALLFNSTVGNAAASLVGLELRLRGPNATISYKEASGLGAIASAVDLVRTSRASALVTGGVDAVYEIFFKTYDRFGVMSPGREFSRWLSPFDSRRKGFVLGEGAVTLWIEPVDAGRPDAPSHGQLLGVGAAGAAVSINQWPDRPEPLVRTMRLAIEDAGLSPEDVDVVYASANASQGLDAVESAALTTLFGGRRAVVTSIKGALGEFGASGPAACAAALLCGRAGLVPPIAGLEEPDAPAASLTLALGAMAVPGPIAIVNSFSSGGGLFSVVLRVAS